MVFDERDHDQRHGASGGRNHAGPASGEGNDNGDAKRGVQPDFGVDPGNDGKSDGLRNQGQRDDDAGEQVAPDIAQPILA